MAFGVIGLEAASEAVPFAAKRCCSCFWPDCCTRGVCTSDPSWDIQSGFWLEPASVSDMVLTGGDVLITDAALGPGFLQAAAAAPAIAFCAKPAGLSPLLLALRACCAVEGGLIGRPSSRLEATFAARKVSRVGCGSALGTTSTFFSAGCRTGLQQHGREAGDHTMTAFLTVPTGLSMTQADNAEHFAH